MRLPTSYTELQKQVQSLLWGLLAKGAYDYWHSSGGEVEKTPPLGREIEQNDSNVPTPSYAQLLEANQKKDETITTQASTIKSQQEHLLLVQKKNEELLNQNKILMQFQKGSWFAWFKGCWKRSNN